VDPKNKKRTIIWEEGNGGSEGRSPKKWWYGGGGAIRLLETGEGKKKGARTTVEHKKTRP